MGFIPLGMVEQQSYNYQMINNRRSGEKWGKAYVGKVMRATLQLWLYRNGMIHTTLENGIQCTYLIQLRGSIETQLKLDKGLMNSDDWYLLGINIHDLMTEAVDSICGWLCDMLIARGDIDTAKEEGTRDRRGLHNQIKLQIDSKRHFWIGEMYTCIDEGQTSDDSIEVMNSHHIRLTVGE